MAIKTIEINFSNPVFQTIECVLGFGSWNDGGIETPL